jgi:uncharacterized protein (TIGR03083 family)
VNRADIAKAVRMQREKLVRDLRTLEPAAWNVESLCAEWKVKDVVAHLIRVGDFYRRPYTFEWDLIRYGFRLSRALADVAKRIAASHSPEELLERLDACAYEETLTFRLHPRPIFALSEWIVHGQDIRRPLGIAATFEPEHLIATAETSQKWYAWDRKYHRLGARLEATDAEFAIGEGQVLRGPLEAITMVALGRTAAMDDLVAAGGGGSSS